MNRLNLTDNQLWIVQRALDFYSRVGIGQFDVIKDHPTFERHLEEVCRPKRDPQVGDRTPQGEILEIKDGKALISGSVGKDGYWSKEHEWKKLEDVKLSTDYGRFHEIRENVDLILVQPRNMLCNSPSMTSNSSWGIYNESVDDSCRIAFDIVQVIRHENWKQHPDRSTATVDSHIHFSHRKDKSSDNISCELNIEEEPKKSEIRFTEWMLSKDLYAKDGEWCRKIEGKEHIFSTEQVYQIYLNKEWDRSNNTF